MDMELASYNLAKIQTMLNRLPIIFDFYHVPKEKQEKGNITFSVHESGNIRIDGMGDLLSAHRISSNINNGEMLREKLSPMLR
jgi:hypothetical protein